jgi:hypothetical protein
VLHLTCFIAPMKENGAPPRSRGCGRAAALRLGRPWTRSARLKLASENQSPAPKRGAYGGKYHVIKPGHDHWIFRSGISYDAAPSTRASLPRKGLEQEFNSLHAQREACEAFIRSQAGEGWLLNKTHYDDGGLSGATMERPALQLLMADIDKRLVDAVVVLHAALIRRRCMFMSAPRQPPTPSPALSRMNAGLVISST